MNAVRDSALAANRAERLKLSCTVVGCSNHPRSAGSPYCEVHYYRLRRNGHLGLLPSSASHEHSAGYIVANAPGHPLCPPGRTDVYLHRKVYYDAHGEGPFKCHVCGAQQSWETMHVDHLDDDPKNNGLDNLAPACPTCNQWRGRHRRAATIRQRGIKVTAFGRTLSIYEWADETKLPLRIIKRRVKEGWSAERALSAPVGPTGPKRASDRA